MFSATAISQRLVQQAGPYTVSSWGMPQKWLPNDPKFKIVPAGGNLPFNYIAHMVITATETKAGRSQVASDLLDVFKAVEKKKRKSIALTAIGTGKNSLLFL